MLQPGTGERQRNRKLARAAVCAERSLLITFFETTAQLVEAGGCLHETTDDRIRKLTVRALPPSAERPPLFVIGDVHGCARELEALIRKARAKVSDCQIVLLGDLFTKGPDPVGVYDVIQEYGALSIKGNHDWALIAALLRRHQEPERLPPHTQQTLRLLRYHRRQVLSFLMSLPHAFSTIVTPKRKPRGWDASFPVLIVHAGIDPTRGLSETPEKMLLTARWVRWDQHEGERRLILVHSSSRQEMIAGNPTAESAQPRFRWHELHQGPDLIIFGHDAKQGLFRKSLPSGRPICIGLDTGCTYGRALTGYFPELDDALQVPSERAYFDVRRNSILVRRAYMRSSHTPEDIES